MTGIAVVTGATAGIGNAFARALAVRGHPLVLVARDTVRLEAVAAGLRGNGGAVTTVAADLSSEDGTARVEGYVRDHPIDVLVNNAGFVTRGVLGATDPRAQDEMVRLHVLAVNRLIGAALPSMRERGQGSLITVSSVSSYLTSAGGANYSATKSYQRVLMESLALELRGTGVYAQALCPGFTHTEIHARAKLNMSSIPEALWMSADDVVTASLRAMDARRPTVVIPGLRWRAITALARLAPRGLLSRRR